MARPKKPPAERRTIIMSCRLTLAERLRIDEAAARAGLTASDYVRTLALSGRVTIEQKAGLNHMTFDELRRIGVNLNQLTRVANRTGFIAPEITRAAASIERLIARELGQSASSGDAGRNAAESDGP